MIPPYQLRLFLIAGGAIPYPPAPFNAADTACIAKGSLAALYPFVPGGGACDRCGMVGPAKYGS